MHLSINTYGCSIRRHKGRFRVASESAGEQFFSAHLVESITLTNACIISTDAILLALEHQIPITFIDKKGKPLGRFWSPHYGSIATIRRRQLEWKAEAAGGSWLLSQLMLKGERQIAVLRQLKPRRPAVAEGVSRSIAYIQKQLKQLQSLQPAAADELAAHLRGLEGSISRAYFSAISPALPAAYHFKKRSQRPATDRFNALLNYLYGMLYHQVEGCLLNTGLDPYLPLMHRDAYAKPTFVYDAIEPFRPWADQVAIDLCKAKSLKGKHFVPYKTGVWLSDKGRAIAIPAFQHYLAAKARQKGKRQSRHALMQQHFTQLAQQLLKGALLE